MDIYIYCKNKRGHTEKEESAYTWSFSASHLALSFLYLFFFFVSPIIKRALTCLNLRVTGKKIVRAQKQVDLHYIKICAS